MDSLTTRPKHAASKSILSMPSSSQLQMESKITPGSKIGFNPSQIYDVNILHMAVKEDSQSTFTYIQSLVKDNIELKNKVAVINEQLDHERKHLMGTIHDYEKLHAIGVAKQHILWQFIQRLTASGDGSQTPPSEPAIYIPAMDEAPRSQQEPNGGNMKLDPNAVGYPRGY